MMLCPQCKKVYGADVVFCLDDGNALIGDGGEQETVVNQHVHFSPPVYTPPAQPVAPASSTNKNILIAILATLSVMLLVVVVFMASGGGIFFKPDNGQTTANKANNDGSNGGSGSNNASAANKTSVKNTSPPKSNDSDNGKDNDVQDLPDGQERRFQGYSEFPNKRLSLRLTLTKNGSSVKGTAVTPNDVDYIEGPINQDGSFDLKGHNQSTGRITGNWRGRIVNGHIDGEWTPSGGGSQVHFSAN